MKALALLLALVPAAALDWPAAPQPARLHFVGEFAGPRQAAAAGRWGRLARTLLGVDDPTPGARVPGGLVQPTGLAARAGTVWVADPGARGVFRYDEASGRGRWLPSDGTPLTSPVAVAAAEDGRLFVADSGSAKVLILDPAGRVTGELRGDPAGLGRPVGLALGGGRLYVADAAGHRVSLYDLSGVYLASFGRRGRGPGEFNFPTYLWYEAGRGRLWVCDSGNFRVQAFDSDGRPVASFGESGNRPGYLARPRGLAFDSDGHAYLVDGAFEALQVFDGAGGLLLFVGRAGGGPGEFNLPGGAFVDAADRLLVADTHNARVQIFQYLKEPVP
ncbi:hypothetical protein EPO15_00880 [bacterium]|nr:MAG: hypothetical protein EPO15_00880 [bacterium]